MKFSIKDFFSFRRIWSHLLKKSLMGNFIFCAVKTDITAVAGCNEEINIWMRYNTFHCTLYFNAFQFSLVIIQQVLRNNITCRIQNNVKHLRLSVLRKYLQEKTLLPLKLCRFPMISGRTEFNQFAQNWLILEVILEVNFWICSRHHQILCCTYF